jgi:RAD51-like protein 3
MRLSSLAPDPASLVSALANVGIRTEVDLLFAHTRDDLLRKLPAGTTTRLELTEYIAFVAKRASASHTRADSLLGKRDSELVDRDIITGVPALDDLFRGLGCKVLEISGDRYAGKTVSRRSHLRMTV